MQNFTFSRDECLNVETALKKEWLETDGCGGFACSTILDCHTRKYHSLLAAPVPGHATGEGSPVADRTISFLSKLEPEIHVEGQVFHLSTNKYPGIYHPIGHKYIDRVSFDKHPITVWRIGDIELRRELVMVRNQATTLIRFTVTAADKPFTLLLRPLLACRDIHTVASENLELQVKTFEIVKGAHKLEPYNGLPPLYFSTAPAAAFYPGPDWWRQVEYLKERSRGYAYQEDLFCPGLYEIDMQPGDDFVFRASLRPPDGSPSAQWFGEMDRRLIAASELRKTVPSAAGEPFPITRSHQFLIRNADDRSSIIAGYPWFGEWGRDAMIALPGLTLCCGRRRDAFDVLATFADREKDGIIPNFLASAGDAVNSVDASLWFSWALQQYVRVTGDLDGVRERLFGAFAEIIAAFTSSSAPSASADPSIPHVTCGADGLISCGDRTTQLTWMDAAIDGVPVTPRHGMAVELNALWFNALTFYCELCERLGMTFSDHYRQLLASLPDAFQRRFWCESSQSLYDVVNDEGNDESIRPNQIFAVSMPHSPLSAAQQKAVVECVRRHLVTPYGLRTLSPRNPAYSSNYRGTPAQRDRGYHQGAVWPWLMGHYVEAELRVSDHKSQCARELRATFAPLYEKHLSSGCIGGVSELFDGDPPYDCKGCFNQAWSVAEVIRAQEMLRSCES
jgi:predicted glycogen debranching enzyme